MKIKIYGYELTVPEGCPLFTKSPTGDGVWWFKMLLGSKEDPCPHYAMFPLDDPGDILPEPLSAILSIGATWWSLRERDLRALNTQHDAHPRSFPDKERIETFSQMIRAIEQSQDWTDAAAEAFRRAKGGE